MNKKMLCLTVLMALAALGAYARGNFDNEAGFQWELSGDGNSIIITGYTGTNTDIWIPPRIQGLPVTGIADFAFSEEGMGDGFVEASHQFTSVIIPGTVTHIGKEAFRGSLLSSVTIPQSVTSIALGAFCSNRLCTLSVNTPHIGDWAFCCNQITSVTLGDNVSFIGEGAFFDNRLISIVIPDAVSYIGDAAFLNNELVSVILPDSIIGIGLASFAANRLSGITIPGNVSFIGVSAFALNPLTSITIGSDVTIGESLPYFESDIFGTSFAAFYEGMGRLAGTYLYTSGVWSKQFWGHFVGSHDAE